REAGYEGKFYTFYGNALGVPAAIGEAGVGRVLAVAEWLPNQPGRESEAFYRAFRARFPRPQDDYLHLRMQMMIDALAQSIERATTPEALPLALALEKAQVTLAGQTGTMRAQDHQFQQALVVGLMQRQGDAGVHFDVEGSGYGFRFIRQLTSEQAHMPHSCAMQRFKLPPQS
ncbi:MAG: ABC transporter substrate-binding protein, partial [Limnohabitans sp.]